MKELTRFELATVKRTANSTKALRAKRTKIEEKIRSLTEELVAINNQIDLFEQPIIQLTGGFTSEEVLNGTMEVVQAINNSQGEVEETTEEATTEDVFGNNECGTEYNAVPFANENND